MPRVQVLPDALVDQIAAGEVVERPASVVKELVENALDAGARRVVVEVEGGGVARISVLDDGCGMGEADARAALLRHATSKIGSFEDLVQIGTLGFRGEALPSIASVSRFTLTTSPDASGLGTQVRVERGAAPSVSPARHAKGTRVEVEDLFGNVPARRKFLKGTEAETRAVVKTFTALALGRPEVAFVLRAGERTLLELPPAASAAARFAEILGGKAEGEVVPVAFSHAGFSLSGAVTRPETTFASRAWQWLFVNGRAVRDASAQHAAQLAAREALRDDRFPAFALFLSCDAALCDVNVHPQKHEVRFRDPGAVHALVHRGLLVALGGAKGATPLGGASLGAPLLRPVPARGGWGPPAASVLAEAVGAWGDGASPAFPAPEPAPAAFATSVETASPLGTLRLLGQYRESFLVAESAAGIVLVDQHVAHERVRFERIRARLEGETSPSQALLVPVPFEATAEEALLLSGADALLQSAGFVVSELAGRSFVVSAAPPDCPAGAVVPFLRDLLERLGETPAGAAAPSAKDALAASLACRGAITIHTKLHPSEAARLLTELSECRDPWTCPHGRPILLTLAHGELLKRFQRI